MDSLTMTTLLLALVAVGSALPTDANAPSKIVTDSFVDTASANLQKVMTVDPKEASAVEVVPEAPEMPKPAAKPEKEMFKDDPLSESMMVNGRAEDFMKAFKSLDTLHETMPPPAQDPATALTEEGASYTPSLPISQGMEDDTKEGNTDDVINHEAGNVQKMGATLEEAEAKGSVVAKSKAAAEAKADAAVKKEAEAAKKEVANDKKKTKDAKKEVKDEEKDKKTPSKKEGNAGKLAKKSAASSMHSLTYATIAATVIATLVSSL